MKKDDKVKQKDFWLRMDRVRFRTKIKMGINRIICVLVLYAKFVVPFALMLGYLFLVFHTERLWNLLVLVLMIIQLNMMDYNIRAFQVWLINKNNKMIADEMQKVQRENGEAEGDEDLDE